MGVFEWTDEMKSAAMADAATVGKQAARIAELEASRLALIRQIDTVVWNFEHGSVTVAEHERAWRNVLAAALANK